MLKLILAFAAIMARRGPPGDAKKNTLKEDLEEMKKLTEEFEKLS